MEKSYGADSHSEKYTTMFWDLNYFREGEIITVFGFPPSESKS